THISAEKTFLCQKQSVYGIAYETANDEGIPNLSPHSFRKGTNKQIDKQRASSNGDNKEKDVLSTKHTESSAIIECPRQHEPVAYYRNILIGKYRFKQYLAQL